MCGEMGERIHLTPDFLAGKKSLEYGPQGMGTDKIFHYVTHNIVTVFSKWRNNFLIFMSDPT
jgi:calcium-activated chloride channel regulator 1